MIDRAVKRIISLAVAAMLLLSGCSETRIELTKEATSISTMDATVMTVEMDTFRCDAAFFGDSITCDGNFDELLPGLRVVNLGVYGDTIGDLRRRVEQLKAEEPAVIFLLGGINSLRPDNVADCLEEYRALLEEIAAACPRSGLVVQSVLPVGAELDPEGAQNRAVRSFNQGLRSLSAEKGLSYLDLWPCYEKNGALDPNLTRDGLHLNFNAYGPWAEAAEPYLGHEASR